VGSVAQIGGSGTTIQLTQTAGINGTADLLQFNSTNSRIFAAQSGFQQFTQIQQVEGSSDAFVRTNQTGGDSVLTIIQGQPSGGVISGRARTLQGGFGNNSLTVQSGANLAAYTAQGGGGSSPGAYFSDAINGFVVVDPSIVYTTATFSRATIFQTEGSGHSAYILQYGSTLDGSVMQTGSGNFGGILQTGANNTAQIIQSGTAGTATVSQKGFGGGVLIQQGGFGNTANVRQN
jgi:trimeric autotransporter adhesin